MGRTWSVQWSGSVVKHFKLDLERLGCVNVRRSNTQQVDSQSMRIALVGRAICHAATAGTTANTMRALLTIRLRCWRVPKFRARTNVRDVDVLDFLGLQETGPG